MAQCNRHHQKRTTNPPPTNQSNPPPSPCQNEPPMHRWPHPIPVHQTPPQCRNEEPTAHYVRCTLAYQNQLLADIKALLQELVQLEKQEES